MVDIGNVLPFGEGWRVHLARGARCVEGGRYEEALGHFKVAHRLAPEHADTCLALGREWLRRGRTEQAEPLLRRACSLEPHRPSAVAALARLLGLGLGRWEEAHAVLEGALARCPDQAALRVVQGELFLEAGQVDEAYDAFIAALDSSDLAAARAGLARACNAKGIALCETAEVEAAMFWFKRAVDCDSGWSGPHLNMGVVFARIGRYTPALEAYERALSLDPRSPLVHFNLANLHRLHGDLAAARAAYERTLEIEPTHLHAKIALGELLVEQGEWGRAIDLFDAALEHDPRNANGWAHLGCALANVGALERAEQAWRRALEHDGSSVRACCGLAGLLLSRGCADEAVELPRTAAGVDCARAQRWFLKDGRCAAWRSDPRFAFLVEDPPPG